MRIFILRHDIKKKRKTEEVITLQAHLKIKTN